MSSWLPKWWPPNRNVNVDRALEGCARDHSDVQSAASSQTSHTDSVASPQDHGLSDERPPQVTVSQKEHEFHTGDVEKTDATEMPLKNAVTSGKLPTGARQISEVPDVIAQSAAKIVDAPPGSPAPTAQPKHVQTYGVPIASPGSSLQSDKMAQNQRLMKFWKDLWRRQAEVLQTRIELDEMRSGVQDERQRVIGLSSPFVELTGDDLDPTTLPRLRQDLLDLCLAIQSLSAAESKLQAAESGLIQQEYMANQLSNTVFKEESENTIQMLSAQEIDFRSQSGASEDSNPDLNNIRADSSPEAQRFLSKMGDVRLLEESLDELRIDRAKLVEKERTRSRFGFGLDANASDFLATFDVQHAALMQDLENAQAELEVLRELLPDRDEVHPDPQLVLLDENLGDLLLLSEPQSGKVFDSMPATTDSEKPNPRDYINSWLLHQLRQSPDEVYRFETILAESLEPLPEQETIRSLVLHTWFLDDTGAATFRNERYSGSSYDQSKKTNATDSESIAPRSEPALPSLRRTQVHLVPTSANTRLNTLLNRTLQRPRASSHTL